MLSLRLPSNSSNILYRQESDISISKSDNGVPLLSPDESRVENSLHVNGIVDKGDNDSKESKVDIDRDGKKLELKPIGSQSELNSIDKAAPKLLSSDLESAKQDPKAQIFADEDDEKLVTNNDKDDQKLEPEKIGSQTELNSMAESAPKLLSPDLESTDPDQKAHKLADLPSEEQDSSLLSEDRPPSKEDLSRFYKSYEEMDSMLNLTNINNLDWKSFPLSKIDFIYSYNKEVS